MKYFHVRCYTNTSLERSPKKACRLPVSTASDLAWNLCVSKSGRVLGPSREGRTGSSFNQKDAGHLAVGLGVTEWVHEVSVCFIPQRLAHQPRGQRGRPVECEQWRLPLEACGAAASGKWSDPGHASPSAAPSLPSVSWAACGYAGASPTLPVCLSWPVSAFPALFLCVYVFFILVHHPGSKIKRSDSSSSISSQSPIGWLLSFVPLTHIPAHWEWLCFLNCSISWLCGICCLYECFEIAKP